MKDCPIQRYETENEHGSGVVLSWGSILDERTREQAERSSRSSVIRGHMALMPDAHLGSGATVGSVMITDGAIIPTAVGVDIGCGMTAVRMDIETARVTKRDERLLLGHLCEAIPNGVAQNHKTAPEAARAWYRAHPNPQTGAPEARALVQFGTLGSGNHFAEYSTDPEGYVWAIVHSGARGVGLQLATHHIEIAKATCPLPVEDPDPLRLPLVAAARPA